MQIQIKKPSMQSKKAKTGSALEGTRLYFRPMLISRLVVITNFYVGRLTTGFLKYFFLYQDLAAAKATASPMKEVVTGHYLKSKFHSHSHPNPHLLIHSLGLRVMCNRIIKGSIII